MKLFTRVNIVSICLFNFFIVSLLGLLMRYKIGFEFPYLDQRNLQHAHSHFAFAGWVTLLLMVLMVKIIQSKRDFNSTYFNILLIIQLVCSYGVLISFIIQGYKFWTILFLVLLIFNSFAFSIEYIRRSSKINFFEGNKWFLAGLFFNFISTLGTFYLSYMMASHTFDQDKYLTSIYWYLHFQYNGFFFFGCLGLLVDYLENQRINLLPLRSIFKMFLISCVPAIGLSLLWMKLPVWIYYLIIPAALVQFFVWFKLLAFIKGSSFEQKFPRLLRYLFVCLALSFTIKFLLQLGSSLPFINQLVFGSRPVIIAYLHLVLLVCISVFLLTYMYVKKLVVINKELQVGLAILILSIYINEILLAIHGAFSMIYILVPYINEMLFGISVCISIGLFMIVKSFWNASKNTCTL
jgi:hypothetical protein